MGAEPLLHPGSAAGAFALASLALAAAARALALALALAFASSSSPFPFGAPFALALLEKGVCRSVLLGGVQWSLVVWVTDAAGHALVEGRDLRAAVG